MAYFSCLLIISFYLNTFVFCLLDEPVCSKFDFEEKVLEKLIKLDVDVNHELKKMAEANAKLEKNVAVLKEEIDGLTKELDLVKTNVHENTALRDMMDDKIGGLVTFEDLRKVQANVSELLVKELDPIFFVVHGTTESPPKNKALVYQTILSNQGDGYNSETGNFIAPRNGVYIFSAQICPDNNVYYQIRVNDVPHSSSYQYSETDGVCSSVSTTALLAESDRVCVYIKNSGVLVENVISGHPLWNMFSGTLIS